MCGTLLTSNVDFLNIKCNLTFKTPEMLLNFLDKEALYYALYIYIILISFHVSLSRHDEILYLNVTL